MNELETRKQIRIDQTARDLLSAMMISHSSDIEAITSIISSLVSLTASHLMLIYPIDHDDDETPYCVKVDEFCEKIRNDLLAEGICI